MNGLLAWEPAIRVGAFVGVLAIMMAWERLAPRRVDVDRARRWPVNFALVVVDTLIVRLFARLLPVAVAVAAEANGWGLMNQFELPGWAGVLATVVAMDFAIYWQHRVFHRVPWLWRLHRVHHSDIGFDTTTGVRFHPAEILLSMAWKLVVVLTLGAPAAGVIVFEVVLSATSLFNHGNVRMPAAADRWLRRLIVTPDMHRVHHSSRVDETDTNFGFNLSAWDRLFGSYRAQPAAGHEAMEIGLERFRGAEAQRLPALLAQPLRGTGDPGDRADGR